jgi:hypothetical protein
MTEDDLNKLSTKEINKRYKLNVLRLVQEGKVGLTSDIEYLKRQERQQAALEESPKGVDKDGYAEIPIRNRIKRHYTVTQDALDQRRKAAKSGKPAVAHKLRGNKNAWKHGKHVADFIQSRLRPCLSTCKDYPCSLVVTNKTKAGQICLDKQEVIGLYYDLKKASEEKKGIGEIAHLMLAEALTLCKRLMEDVLHDGNTLAEDRRDKDGILIGQTFVPHPNYGVLTKFMPGLGITLDNFMLTPASVEKAKLKDKENETMAAFTSRLLKSLGPEGGKQTGNSD